LLGRYLAKNKGRTLDGLRLESRYDKHAKVQQYQIAKA